MSLSETEENPFFIVGMVGALRFKGKSYEEIATQLKFDSVEEMRNRLESLQLPGWFVGAETSSDKKRVREKSTPRLREVGQAKDLPPAGNATELFKERLEGLLEDAELLRACADRSWSARRSALPSVANPALSDQPPHDDHHIRERHPEVDHPPYPLRTPHQLLVGVVPRVGPLRDPTLPGL